MGEVGGFDDVEAVDAVEGFDEVAAVDGVEDFDLM